MRYQGRIASWNEARGFGFITPEQHGDEQASHGVRGGLFVHITALQSDGRLPEPGERVTYLIGSGQDGKPRALQVFFPDRPLTLADAGPSAASFSASSSAARSATPSATPSWRAASQPPRPTATRERSNPYRRRKSSWRGKLIPLLVLAGLFSIYSRFSAESMAPLPISSFNQEEASATVSTPQATTFIRQCDGREYCSQMTSCEEATWFLQNCPNTKMDGEGDGIPCENQWCGH
ncbi:excalibur calcium-binding domain-containing protein [Aeromonas allosaccharophila]|uniref:Excalibur calcium-binding domain-containing protein n=1 Tax=Aeromonas allosaccharophila TaxID=656 RepID=A0A7T2PC86_9GAMM|nr:excalibur calcium-binding domain-containing protein [Aeromonas allosaccharophila]QPR52992.1 excalibur calcium-binding domain-containing protein [Aeromonas allosaccharophila]